MVNFDRDRFKEMNTRERDAFVNDLVVKNTKLTEEELNYLVPQNREKYFFNRVRTSDWLENMGSRSWPSNQFLQRSCMRLEGVC